jgi:hypothetical protein
MSSLIVSSWPTFWRMLTRRIGQSWSGCARFQTGSLGVCLKCESISRATQSIWSRPCAMRSRGCSSAHRSGAVWRLRSATCATTSPRWTCLSASCGACPAEGGASVCGACPVMTGHDWSRLVTGAPVSSPCGACLGYFRSSVPAPPPQRWLARTHGHRSLAPSAG